MFEEHELTEDEYLQREARLATEALARLRGEITDSLRRSADVGAWTDTYPLPVIGTAAMAGLAAGWAMGHGLRKKKDSGDATDDRKTSAASKQTTAAESHPAGRLVAGLGTLVGAFASAAVGAASQAFAGIIKDSLRDSFRPEPTKSPSANGNHQDAPP